MKTLIINDSDDTLPEAFLEAWVGDVSRELHARKVMAAELQAKELSLVFLKEIDAKQLNWTHRQKDYATDVLSFASDDPESVGELVMCPIVLRKQAKEHKLSYEEELGYMILHGVLHLLGYDHEADEEKARVMMTLQDGVFEAILESRRPKKEKPKASAVAKTTPKTPAKNAAAGPAKKAKTAAAIKVTAKAAPTKAAPKNAKAASAMAAKTVAKNESKAGAKGTKAGLKAAAMKVPSKKTSAAKGAKKK